MRLPSDPRIEALRKKLQASPGALTSGTIPTKSQLGAAAELRGLQDVREGEFKEAQKLRFPSPEDVPVQGKAIDPSSWKDKSLLRKAMTVLGAGVSAGAGVAEWATGTGSKKRLWENVKANIAEQGSYGDILRAKGISNAIALPAGFALDVALDPLTWLTAGTSALVPRIAKGAVEGGLAGAKLATESSLLGKAGTALKWGSKDWRNMLDAGRVLKADDALVAKGILPATPSWMVDLATRTNASTKAYEDLVYKGSSFLAKGSADRMTWFDKAIKGVKTSAQKTEMGQKIGGWINKLVADPDGYFITRQAAEEAARSGKTMNYGKTASLADEARALSEKGDLMGGFQREFDRNFSALYDPKFAPLMGVEERNAQHALTAADEELWRKQINDAVELLAGGDAKKKAALSALDPTDLRKKLSVYNTYATGFSGLDKAVAKAVNVGLAEKMLNLHSKVITVFRTAAVGLSPVTRVNSVLGNLSYRPMMGLNVLDPMYYRRLVQSKKLVFDGDLQQLDLLFGTSHDFLPKEFAIRDFVSRFPTLSSEITGLNPGLMIDGQAMIAGFRKHVAAVKASGNEKLAEFAANYVDELDDIIAKVKSGTATAEESAQYAANTKAVSKLVKETSGSLAPFSKAPGAVASQGASSMFSQDFAPGSATALWKDELLKTANANKGVRSQAARLVHNMISKPMEDYGRYDSAFKVADLVHLTKDGITEGELRRVSNWLKLEDGKDFVRGGPMNLYYLSPEAALRVSNTAFMNYGSLPKIVQVMKRMPILGSPFASFSYAVAANYARALQFNPSYFLHVNELMREVSGVRDPLEKKALESKYYQYLNKPEMMKLPSTPLFDNNPMFMNMGNIFGYYTMNFMQPSQRSYGDKFGDKVGKAIDDSGLFKDPVGQFLLDYLVMPHVLSESMPQNQFGVPLYPVGASTAEKAGLAASAFVSPLTPRIAGLAGILPSVLPEPVSEDAVQYVPSGTYRKIRNATKGRTASGMPASESKPSRTFRALMSEAGFPTYQVNLDFIAKEVKDKNSSK